MKLFGTWYWGFRPEIYPFAGFSSAKARNRLIEAAVGGGRLAVVATNNPTRVPKEERRRLLGMLEFDRRSIDVNETYEAGTFPLEFQDKNGGHIWPHAVPILRAWRFDPAPIINEIIGRNFSPAARNAFETFKGDVPRQILDVPHFEVEVAEFPLDARTAARSSRERSELRGGRIQLDRSSGQPGPPPSSWSAVVSHSDGPTTTYLAQFGDHAAWKIGISQNPSARMKALNFSIPRRITGCEWALKRTQQWPSGSAAYEMERAILRGLADLKPSNEQVVCPAERINAAWDSFLAGARSATR